MTPSDAGPFPQPARHNARQEGPSWLVQLGNVEVGSSTREASRCTWRRPSVGPRSRSGGNCRGRLARYELPTMAARRGRSVERRRGHLRERHQRDANATTADMKITITKLLLIRLSRESDIPALFRATLVPGDDTGWMTERGVALTSQVGSAAPWYVRNPFRTYWCDRVHARMRSVDRQRTVRWIL